MGDGPSNIMSPQMFVDKAEQVRDALKRLGKLVWMKVLRMKELVEGGFGGIIGVGQSAAAGSDREPALIHLSYSFGNRTAENSRRWAMVGMNGMKGDILGASDQLYTFKTAVETGDITNGQLHVVLCVAGNSVSAWSCRPGDVLTMHSGRTVEVSNTDAEGCLVLADGVSYAAGKAIERDYLMTTATLTGAQGVATGKRHGAVMSTSERLEKMAVKSGKRSGDTVFPVLYSPELLKREFSSKVADMRNSARDGENAQVSCASQFIVNHLPDEFLKLGGKFAHLEIAAPAAIDGRATGFSVSLLVDMVFQGSVTERKKGASSASDSSPSPGSPAV